MSTKIIVSVFLVGFLSLSAASVKKHPLLKLDALKDFVEVEEGKVSMDSGQFQVEGFFISRYEITNQKYQEFLQDLKDRGQNEALSAAQIKNANWNSINVGWDIEEKYHTYHGFTNFPVVNVTYEGAQLYCQWLTEKINREIKDDYFVEVRLPTRKEWIRAARGETKQVYAWHHPYLMGTEGKLLCNFKRLGAERIHFNEQKNEYEIIHYKGPVVLITSRVDEFPPNTFGLYNTCGNVAEMIAEKGVAVGGNFNSPGYDVRVESVENYLDASPLVGFRPVMVIRDK